MRNRVSILNHNASKATILIAIISLICFIEYWDKELKYKKFNPRSSVIWPLRVGNKWIYKGYRSPKYYIEITEIKEINKDKVFVLKAVSQSELYYQHLRNHKEGLSSYGVIGKQFFIDYGMFRQPVLVFKFPAFSGESYDLGGVERVTIKSINEKVSTPLGNFRCYKYYYKRLNGFSILWMAPNIGIIKEFGKVHINGGDYYYRLLLESYKVEKSSG